MNHRLHEQLDNLFNPRSVAVIGASPTFGSWGFGTLNSLMSSQQRKIYPVNRHTSEILGLKTYQSVSDIPDSVDFAVISISAQRIPGVLRECSARGVKAALIVSSNFSEAGEEGRKREKELVDVARELGIRFVGPNSMGHANATASFSTMGLKKDVPRGSLSLISQSGGYGLRLLQSGEALGLGFSKFVSTGNEADLHLEDYLDYFAADRDTRVIGIFLEGLREGKRFFKLAKHITREKPIIVIKTGTTTGSARAARSHSAALAGSDAVYNAAFKQTGVIRVYNDDEFFDVVQALLFLPLPRGRRVGILTAGGGIGALATDVCEQEGLEVPPFSAPTMKRLNKLLPAYWPHHNPADITDNSVAGTGQDATFDCMEVMMADENKDAVMVIGGLGTILYLSQTRKVALEMDSSLGEQLRIMEEKEAERVGTIRNCVDKWHKPLVITKTILKSAEEPKVFRTFRQNRIPVYPSPQRAVRALHHLVGYKEYLDA